MRVPPAASTTLLVLVSATSACHARQMEGAGGRDGGAMEVVVANQQSASASLIGDDGTIRNVHVGTGPHEAQVSPDGRIAVVTVYGTQTPGNQLAVIDLVRDTVVRTIDLGRYTRPHGVVFLAGSSDRVAVTSEATNTVLIVDLSTGAIQAIPTNARGSHMVAVSEDGTRAWTANVADNSVSELDLTRGTFVRTYDDLPSRPEGITVTPDGEEVWVGSNDTGAVTVISTSTGQVLHTLTGARFPYRLAASPDGSRIAIVDGMGGALLVADVLSKRVVTTIPLVEPRGVSIAGDNRTAWVTLGGGQVVEVDIEAGTVLRTLDVQVSPDGVGVGHRR
jgi:DNA-binding beta-propeller fold protein YncE